MLKVPEFLRDALVIQLATNSNAEWVFPAPNGSFLRGDNFRWRIWTPATLAAGTASEGEPFTFHELRHTAAAFMVDGGADPLQVMRRMGHTDIRTTYNLYGHLFPDREDELVGKLNSRHDRALRPTEVAVDGQDQENAFEFSLSSTPSEQPRGELVGMTVALTRGNV